MHFYWYITPIILFLIVDLSVHAMSCSEFNFREKELPHLRSDINLLSKRINHVG